MAQKNLGPLYPLASIPVELVWLDQTEFDRKKDLGGVAMEAVLHGRLLYHINEGRDD